MKRVRGVFRNTCTLSLGERGLVGWGRSKSASVKKRKRVWVILCVYVCVYVCVCAHVYAVICQQLLGFNLGFICEYFCHFCRVCLSLPTLHTSPLLLASSSTQCAHVSFSVPTSLLHSLSLVQRDYSLHLTLSPPHLSPATFRREYADLAPWVGNN